MNLISAMCWLRRSLLVLVALGLVFAPLQATASVQPAKPMAVMDMSAMQMPCPVKKSCCGDGKSECPMMQACTVQCSLITEPPMSPSKLTLMMDSIVYGEAPGELSPFSVPPLRRPPRF